MVVYLCIKLMMTPLPCSEKIRSSGTDEECNKSDALQDKTRQAYFSPFNSSYDDSSSGSDGFSEVSNFPQPIQTAEDEGPSFACHIQESNWAAYRTRFFVWPRGFRKPHSLKYISRDGPLLYLNQVCVIFIYKVL